MRLHHLSITAFGPFADTVEIDFDELSQAGLFLLTGATGAGKTSVLDAVCFALYGQVPGDRAGAKHLRSDHAPPQAAPEVVLRFSVGERQLLFRRSPAWTRPKLRGTGVTKVQAHVLVEELSGGAWTTLTNRLDDAGLLVTELLGMTSSQFNQVAMLPQGRFQAFLRATSAERHAVLQQLFRTDRFERVERWLVERRGEARRASESHLDTVLESVNRLREAGGEDADPPWADLDVAIESGAVQHWATAAAEAAAVLASSAAERSVAADRALAAAEDELAGARRAHELHDRGIAAQRELAALEAGAPDVESARTQLAAHRQATPLAGLATAHTAAEQAAGAAAERWSTQRTAVVAHLGPEFTRDDLGAAVRRAQTALTLATGFRPRQEARVVAGERLAAARARMQTIEAEVAEIELTIAQHPGVIADAAAAVHEARAAAARYPVVTAAVERLEDLIAAVRRAELVGLELVAARTDVLTATDVAQLAREQYLDIREARINGMAGELAGQLASGCSCPVCGSAEHPAPASSDSAGVGRAEEDQARKAAEDAAFELQARQVGLGTLEGELGALDERLLGVDRDALPQELTALRTEAERLEPLVSALDVLVAREQECRSRLREAEQTRGEALLERAALAVEIGQLEALLATIAAEWETLLAAAGSSPREDPTSDLETVIGFRNELLAVLERAVADHDVWQQAVHRAEDSAAVLARAAHQAGFPSAADALAALLPDAEVAGIEARIAEAAARRTRAEQTLADQHVVAALGSAPPDLEEVTTAHVAAVAEARAAVSARDSAAQRSARIAELVRQTLDRADAWVPVRAEYRTVAELTSLVEGKSVDNPLRMRLAAYVLAERLRQVVRAANERLARMTDQRYTLEHSDDRGYGEQRGGLSLRVRDDWNGVHRDPATLSGGETFVVSLALALGLADTVAHEAGGTDIDTLFIDEGFGSLDADTLEDVMDTLDSLRDGGRVVGLVSHVPELRSRITTQLEVSKGRTGSTVRTAVGRG